MARRGTHKRTVRLVLHELSSVTPCSSPGCLTLISSRTQALLATGVGGTRVQCRPSEFLSFPPPSGSTCGDYMATYIQAAGGYLADPSSTTNCQFCSISDTNTFLKTFNYNYDHRWRGAFDILPLVRNLR